MTQQDSRPAQPHESNTYLILGNLLEQRGETEKAKEVWRRGLRRHPGDAQLTAKVGG
jgi:Tfp pilus assembly protein PilF